MIKSPGYTAIALLVAVVVATGCKHRSASAPTATTGYFHTSFQDESQYIVEAVVSDLAEQMYYASFHRLPKASAFQVTAMEKSGCPLDAPIYELNIRLDPKLQTIQSEINVNGPIWSAAVYQGLAKQLGRVAGLTAANAGSPVDTSLISKLTDGTAETIERQNEQLSAALEENFTDPHLHEQAALLLGAFMLRDHSGNFFDIRAPLSRMTAQLAMARFLNGTNSYDTNGKIARAMLLTLINDESPALRQLREIGTNDPVVAPIVRALWTRDTGDYRLLGSMNNLTPVECVEWFYAMAGYLSAPLAWSKINDVQKQTIDFVRIAYEEDYSVEMGHELLAAALPLELREIESIYEMTHHQPLGERELADALNAMPDRCLTTAPDGSVRVRVIGWGQWANFLQRHLCHAIQSDFNFLQYGWGVPDEAREFASKCDQEFSGLRLYPFVERFDATDVNTYHKSVDAGFKVTVDTPQLTPAECWNYLCYDVNFAPRYCPVPNPHVNEWHRHNPPPGTVYNLYPRLNHPSLIDRPDAVAFFEKLHKLAPYDCRIINFIITHKYDKHPSYEQATNLCQGLLPYSMTAMRLVANSCSEDPPRYESIMLQAAQLDPTCYYTLADYELRRDETDKAAQYYDKGCNADLDSVRVANYAPWRVQYYLKKGDFLKARAVADFAGEVYSYRGLEAEGIYFEAVSNYPDAFEWYEKIEDRYNDSNPLIDFCARYKTLTGNGRFDAELQKRLTKLFPNGLEKASLPAFHGPPGDGVLILQQNGVLQSFGLRAGDVIVALNGTRTHSMDQYRYVRDTLTTPELDLIVWQGSAYHEIKADPPNHVFGVDFGDYKPQ